MNARCSFGEPWKVYQAEDGSVSVVDALGGTVAQLDQDWASSDADRIVACVNAMNGVRDPMQIIIRFRPLSDRM